jgi:hypothetical protein
VPVTEEGKIEAIKAECRTKANDALVYITIFQKRAKRLTIILQLIKAVGILVLVCLALTVMSFELEFPVLKQVIKIATGVSAMQVLLTYISYSIEWDSKLSTYQKLVATLTQQRTGFLHINGMIHDNYGHLYHGYRVDSERHNVTIEEVSRYNILRNDFKKVAKDIGAA